MTIVEIQSHGHQVRVDHDSADLTYITDKALELWHATRGPDRDFPAVGFTAERRATREPRNRFVATTAEIEQP